MAQQGVGVPVIAIERYRVEHGDGFTMPVVSLTDRRAAGNRLVRFVFQRHLETVLYGRSEGSSGPIWKVMNAAGIGATTLAINKANVASGLITDVEYTALLDVFKSALPADVVDPSSLGRIRAPSCPWPLPPRWYAPSGAPPPPWRGCARSPSPFLRPGS